MTLCYRKTATNPGRYLEAALRRAGAEVEVVTNALDWGAVRSDAKAVIFVESPLPPIEVRGTNPGIPVAFWVHHGEHHLPANLRLARRYGAHLVLLAHSWHLAHRFDVPVERFPFAVAPELFDGGLRHPDRPIDVAFAGAHISEGGPYQRRQWLLARVKEGPHFIDIREGVPPEEVAGLYGRAKVVLNEGGEHHFPITMRVFEAIGAGALLLTDPSPGLEMLFRPDQHYLHLEADPLPQLARLLAEPHRVAGLAAAAFRHALDQHTYDHRVDQLLQAIEVLAQAPPNPPGSAGDRSPLAAVVDADPEVQRVAAFGAPRLRSELPDREVWDGERVLDRLTPRSYDAVALGSLPQDDLAKVLMAARRYVYADRPVAEAVTEALSTVRADAEVRLMGGVLRADLRPDSYRLPEP